MEKKNEVCFTEDITQNLYCPNVDCGGGLEISEKNCGIFIHAWNKETNEQINPHASRKECEYLIENHKIHGCGKPFFVEYNPTSGTFVISSRDYEN